MSIRIIGLGQPAAGDDGVGWAVIAALRAGGLAPGAELVEVAEPSALLPWLDSTVPVVLVDAVLASPAGCVLELGADDLESRDLVPLSTHGMSLAQAIALARVLGGGQLPVIRLVAVTIARPDRYRSALSAPVAAAVPEAARRVAALVEGWERAAGA